jgi:hypothetical protein
MASPVARSPRVLQGGVGHVGLEECAEVAADEAAQSAGDSQGPFRGDRAAGDHRQQGVGQRAGDRGDDGAPECGGGDGSDRHAGADEDWTEE